MGGSTLRSGRATAALGALREAAARRSNLLARRAAKPGLGNRRLAQELDRGQLESFAHAAGFPNDRNLLEELGLLPWYERIYRLSSDYVHFSLCVATDELRDNEEVHFESGDPDLAHEGLSLAILIYGQFLQLAEKTIKHGLTKKVLEIVKSSSAFASKN